MANNGKTSASLSNKILDAFEILAQAEVSSAQFDKTITGIVISCEDEATGRYKVQYQDAIFYAFSTALDVTYSKGTSVQVKIPNNDFSGRKMIIGTVEENGIDHGALIEDPLLRYEYIGIDCINSTEQYDLSSYWNEEKNNIILYDIEKNIDLLNLNEQMLEDNLKQANSILLGATIQTNIPDVQKFKGDYGIKYTLTFNDIANVEAKVDRYYIIDIDKMSGDPYAYDRPTDQMIPFDIDNKNFCYIKKIELFAKHFIYKDDEKPADIFISNLRLQTANRLSEDEFAGTALTILTPEGNYFTQTESLSSKQVIAQVRMKGKVVGNSLKKVDYYWFIEDLRVYQTDQMGYHRYGGRGWKCLNEYTITEGDEDNPISIDYVAGKETFIINKENSKARNTKYKCVINYNNQILEREFYFINYGITDEVIITAEKNPNFINNIGMTTLLCTSTNGVKYQWAKVDSEGGFEVLRETTADNEIFNKALIEYNNLLFDINSGNKPDNDINRALLNQYQEIIQKYNKQERIEGNRIINLQAKSIYKQAIYKCQAFDENDNNLGIDTQLVTNYISVGDNLQTGSLIINNGTQVFKYDANGIAPTNGQFENPQTILPLSFTLRNAQGIEIPTDALNNQDITWIVPIKNTMLKNYVGNVLSHDEENGIEVYNGKSLGYNINEYYYATKDNNDIELRVRYQDLVYTAKTNFLFTKDGDNGTNGTGYVLKIIPDANTIGRLKTVIPSHKVEMGWLRAQLWYNGIKIFEGDQTGKAEIGGDVTLKWSLLGELDKEYGTTHNISVENVKDNGTLWFANSKENYVNTAIDIVKAVAEYDGHRIVATMPVIYSPDLDIENYKVSLKSGTGFTHVVYSPDGLTPTYDNHTPFELTIHKYFKDDKSWGDLTGHSSLSYHWTLIGDLKFARGYEDVDENGKKLGYSTLSQIMVEPTSKYNDEILNNAIICVVKENESIHVGTFHIPIHFLVNTYGNSALNDWDGNSLSVNVESNVMLSPQGGFGKKEADNSYTGVFLGTVKDYENNVEHTGLFGYDSGKRTIFLNSENGAAIFGSASSSQIMIDPNAKIIAGKTGAALLYSNDFYRTYDEKTGLPINYSTDNENRSDPNDERTGQGALIDLTTPQIRWGNGNFKVDEYGHITARGGGSIAGWNIDDNALFTQTSDKDKNVRISSADFKKTINGTGREDWRMTFSNNFGVASDGTMHAASGIIGAGTNKITLGKSSANGGFSALYSGSKSAFNANTTGFYVGTDGISLGGTFTDDANVTVSNFQVDHKGNLIARTGYIGGRSNGWTIADRALYNGKTSIRNTSDTNETGVYLGTLGLGLGKTVNYGTEDNPSWHSAFEVSNTGALYANNGVFKGRITSTSGSIGGWTIGSSKLTGGNITLNSNGSISGGSDYKWSIATNGAATFNYIKANGGKIAGYNIDGDTLYGSQVGMDAENGDNYAFWAGAEKGNSANAPFRVGHSGSLVATKATITGEITATSGSFTGTITANKGSIGGWTIGSSKLSAGDGSSIKTVVMQAPTEKNNWVFAAGGTSHSSYSDCPFRVNKAGELYASGATITGTLNTGSLVTGSTISGSTFKAGKISINKNGYYLEMGYGTDHPEVSGLNVTGTGGIAMGGTGISNCSTIGRGGSVFSFKNGTGSNALISTEAYLKVSGSAYLMIGDRNLNTYVNDVVDTRDHGGETKTFWLELGKGDSYPSGGWKQFVVQNGLLKHIY